MTSSVAASGSIVNVLPVERTADKMTVSTLIKADVCEVRRLVLPAGKVVAAHAAPGSALVLCLEGRVDFTVLGRVEKLQPGQLVYMTAGESHAVTALEDSTLLVMLMHTR